jgi:hypothetical protein
MRKLRLKTKPSEDGIDPNILRWVESLVDRRLEEERKAAKIIFDKQLLKSIAIMFSIIEQIEALASASMVKDGNFSTAADSTVLIGSTSREFDYIYVNGPAPSLHTILLQIKALSLSLDPESLKSYKEMEHRHETVVEGIFKRLSRIVEENQESSSYLGETDYGLDDLLR